MLLLIWFTAESWISGYRDMVRFVYKGTWNRDELASWVPYWDAPQSSKKDPFHIAGGTMWALIVILLVFESIYHWFTGDLFTLQPLFMISDNLCFIIATFVVHCGFFWLYFYYSRNLLMHIFGRSKKEWKYLNPLWKQFDRRKK